MVLVSQVHLRTQLDRASLRSASRQTSDDSAGNGLNSCGLGILGMSTEGSLIWCCAASAAQARLRMAHPHAHGAGAEVQVQTAREPLLHKPVVGRHVAQRSVSAPA